MNVDVGAKKTRGRPRNAVSDKSGGTVQALNRGLSVLAALAKQDKATLTELAMTTGMPPSTAHRLLMTLQVHGFTDFDEATNMWMVGVEAFRTGSSFVRRTSVAEAARDVMHDLVEATGETANLAVADGAEVVFVYQVETSNPVRAFFGPGARAPMHSSGIGKALLAQRARKDVERLLQRSGLPELTANTHTTADALFTDLDAIHARSWSFDDEEGTLGMRCVAAPIFDAMGNAIAGVSVSGPSARLNDNAVGEFGPIVRRMADRITERIGGVRPKVDSAA